MTGILPQGQLFNYPSYFATSEESQSQVAKNETRIYAFTTIARAPVVLPTHPPVLDHDSRLAHILTASKAHVDNPPTSKTYVLFRAIGNDLPPRHAIGQTYDNVRFILENQRELPDLDVRWYVNRVVNRTEEYRIVQLLIHHHQQFIVNSVNLTDYSRVDYNLHGSSMYPDVLRSPPFRDHTVQDVLYRNYWDKVFTPKNQYIIQNNQVRNAMLRLGIEAGARYVLPWDGNCFLNQHAWFEITRGIEKIEKSLSRTSAQASKLYFTVPMVRMTGNDPLRNASWRPKIAIEEPQIIFHRNATARFDERKYYGFRPKVDLLWRLGIPEFQYKSKGKVNYSALGSNFAKDLKTFDSVRSVGWTARLFSGKAELEGAGKGLDRGAARSEGVEQLAAKLSLQVARHLSNFSRQGSLMLYDRELLSERLSAFSQLPGTAGSGAGMGDDSCSRDEVLLRATVSSVVRVAENFALDVVVRKRGVKCFPVGHEKEIALFARNVSMISLATLFTGDTQLGEKGSAVIRDWLVSERKVNFTGVKDIRAAPYICLTLDAVRMLRFAGSMADSDLQKVQDWMKGYAQYLDTSPDARRAYFNQTDVESVYYELGSACVHIFLGHFDMALRRTALARGRMFEHFAKDSAFLAKNGVRGLVGWFLLANVAEKIGVDLWHFREQGASEPLLVSGMAQVFDQRVPRDGVSEYLAGWLVDVSRTKLKDEWTHVEKAIGSRVWALKMVSPKLFDWECIVPPLWNLAMVPALRRRPNLNRSPPPIP